MRLARGRAPEGVTGKGSAGGCYQQQIWRKVCKGRHNGPNQNRCLLDRLRTREERCGSRDGMPTGRKEAPLQAADASRGSVWGKDRRRSKQVPVGRAPACGRRGRGSQASTARVQTVRSAPDAVFLHCSRRFRCSALDAAAAALPGGQTGRAPVGLMTRSFVAA